MVKKRFVSDIPELLCEWDWNKNIISPYNTSYGSAKLCYWRCSKCGFSWSTPVYSRGSNGCGCPECAKVIRGITRSNSSAKINSLLINYPDIAKEWHPTKNDSLSIESISSFSNKKVWWLCSACGNEWATTVNHRTKENTGCPICARERVPQLKKKTHARRNNFAENLPDIAKEWHPFKNENLMPSDVSVKSNVKVWWLCSYCGYEWKTTVSHRSAGQGCPNCSKAQSSFSEQAVYYYLSKIFPDALHRHKQQYEFDIFIPSKNIAVEYDGYFFHSGEDKLSNDNAKDRYCKENGILLIRLRSPRLPDTESAIRIDCEERKIAFGIHEILRIINSKTRIDIDVNRDTIAIQQQFRHIQMANSIENKYPNLLEEWHTVKNGNVKPYSVSYASSLKFWWLCKTCGYEWQDTPNHRTSRGSGCPFCANKVVIEGKNDLKSSYPHLADEWNDDKNLPLLPTQVSAKSNKKVWWKCLPHGHEWQAVISERTREGHQTNCPYCGNKKVLQGFNDLATTNPNLAKEWNCEKNDFMPTDVTKGSHKKAWWKCNFCGYEWEAVVYSRQKCGCPSCAGKIQKSD